MAKVYPMRIKAKAIKALKGRPSEKAAYEMARGKFTEAHKELLKDFNKHTITQEIQAGPSAENISGRLGGYGNLFSFIGFARTDRPMDTLKSYLKYKPKIRKHPTVKSDKNSVSYTFRIETPNISEMEALAQTPWGGRSWLRGIERGISGLGFFLYNAQGVAGSRSNTGIQTENRIRGLAYRPIKYMSTMVKKFRSKVDSR